VENYELPGVVPHDSEDDGAAQAYAELLPLRLFRKG
jgi:hypothetical protein